jgi:hypothetical protein
MLRFGNLGPTPGDHRVTVMGNIYVLMIDGSDTAIVFDPRFYETNPPSDEYNVKFKQVGSFEIATELPPSLLAASSAAYESFTRPFGEELDEIKKVFVVNLSGQSPADIGWRQLQWIFPGEDVTISHIPVGRTNWNPITEDERERSIIHLIEETDLVERGEKVEIDPFTLYLFCSNRGGTSSVLVAGQINGRDFTVLFAEEALHPFFPDNEIRTEALRLHHLSAGRWYGFYPDRAASYATLSNPTGPTPVKVLHGRT